jgi:hypothetical protein
MDDFTATEYATAHGLSFDPRSQLHQRRLAKHLREIGYRPAVAKRKGVSTRVWRRAERVETGDLDAQLRQIEASHTQARD